jgi:ubiquinol-cytochrome c reductase cytochrome b subunit
MTEDQLIRQVLQGGGNMPAYGKNLAPSEVTALVSFLETLHPINEPPAADASRTAAASRADHWISPPVTTAPVMLASRAKLIDQGDAK